MTAPVPKRSRARLLALAALVAIALGGGCRVDTSINLDVDRDGAGRLMVEVYFDDQAAARIGDLATKIRTDDLVSTGWTVDGPTPTNGGQRFRVSRRFATPEDGQRLIRSLATEDGPFGQVRLEQQRGWWRTTTTLDLVVDLTGGIEAFGDQALTDALGGARLGVAVEDIEQRLGAPAADAFTLKVNVKLPGSAEATDGAEPPVRQWQPKIGERTVLAAASTDLYRARIALAVVALLAASVALAPALRMARRRRTPMSSEPRQTPDEPTPEA